MFGSLVKKVVAVAAALLLAAVLMPGMVYGQNAFYYWVQVKDQSGQPFTEDGLFNCSVYTLGNAGRDTGAAIHATSALTTGLNILYSDVSGKVHFYSTTDTAYQLKCYSKYGDFGYINKMTRSTHDLMVDTASVSRVTRIPFASQGAATQTSTGFFIPRGGLVRDVLVETDGVPVNHAHLSVGFGGNHAASVINGLVHQLDISGGYNAASPLRPHIMNVLQADTPVTFSYHRGALLVAHRAGSLVGLTATSFLYEQPYMVHQTSALEVVYRVSPNQPANSVGGHIYLIWERYHLGINRQLYR